jgi:hypothetical protein
VTLGPVISQLIAQVLRRQRLPDTESAGTLEQLGAAHFQGAPPPRPLKREHRPLPLTLLGRLVTAILEEVQHCIRPSRLPPVVLLDDGVELVDVFRQKPYMARGAEHPLRAGMAGGARS